MERDDKSLKIAVAMALLRRKLNRNEDSNNEPSLQSDALRWKRKAKERKQELIKLKEELKVAEDGMLDDLFPQNASCKCYFFDNMGKFSSKEVGDNDSSNVRFNDVLRRRFLRQVRLKERRKRRENGLIKKGCFSELNTDDDKAALKASADFLVELCDTVSNAEEANFANWSHQAVDFILASLKNLLLVEKNLELIEGCINSLIMRLVRRMSSQMQKEGLHHPNADLQFYVQHLIRMLGSESYIGQRAILSVSQRICVLTESLLFMDPFDSTFPSMHSSMYIMIQLIEFMVSDNLSTWAKDERFDSVIFQEWVTFVLHARKALELLENRNGLYVLYMDRVIGELGKVVAQTACLQKLNQDILDNLFI